MTMAEVAAALDEDRAQETPAEIADLDPEDPALIVFTSGTTGEPRAALHAQRYLPGQRAQAEHWLGARDGRAGLVHDRDRVVEVGAQRLPRAVALRRGGDDRRRALRARRAARADRARARRRRSARRRPSTGCWRKRAELRPLPSVRRMVSAGEALEPRGDRGLARGDRARDRRRLRPDRDRAPDRQPRRRRRCATARWAGRCPGFELRIADGRAPGPGRELPDLLRPLPRRRAVRGRVVADRRRRPRGRRRLPLVRGPQRRPDPLRRLPDRARSRSSRRCSATRRSPRRRRSRRPTPSAARSCGRSSSCARASPPTSSPASCRSTSSRSTAPYKYPRIVEFADELPKTASGKIKRAELRAELSCRPRTS